MLLTVLEEIRCDLACSKLKLAISLYCDVVCDCTAMKYIFQIACMKKLKAY